MIYFISSTTDGSKVCSDDSLPIWNPWVKQRLPNHSSTVHPRVSSNPTHDSAHSITRQKLLLFAHLPGVCIRLEPDTLQADWPFHGRHLWPVSLLSFQSNSHAFSSKRGDNTSLEWREAVWTASLVSESSLGSKQQDWEISKLLPKFTLVSCRFDLSSSKLCHFIYEGLFWYWWKKLFKPKHDERFYTSTEPVACLLGKF